jgi:uncharacterized cupredoxin-like copper-binding protein
MSTSFQKHHGAMLLKYAGISFISGAVNHGFFSGVRSLWTAAIGMVLFVLGAWLEHRLSDSETEEPRAGLASTLLWGSLLSIGLGFFTGGLQHFPDSPARSAWVVPLGFAISVLALAISSSLPWQRASTVYALVVGAVVCAFSWGAYRWLDANPGWADGGHSHGAAPAGLVAQTVSRSVSIHMDDNMRFTPDKVDVQAGEVIRFVVHNGGAVPHEFVLGNEKEIAEHAEVMRNAASMPADHSHQHGAGAALSVKPGEMGELVVTFSEPSTVQIACLIPGHYEAGMRGSIDVKAAPAGGPKPAASSMAGGEHKH